MTRVTPHTINHTSHRARAVRREPQPPVSEMPEQEAARRIERVSPEGRPAMAREGTRWGVVAIVLELVVMATLGVVIGVFFSWTAGLLVFGLGTVLGTLANSEFWALLGRIGDQQKASGRRDA